MRNAVTLAEPVATPVITLIEFPEGLIGFSDARSFTLVRWGEDPETYFSVLKSMSEVEVEFVVVPPNVFFPDYAPEVDDATAAKLGLTDAEEALVLVIVTVGESPEDCTANLLGPVVINTKTLVGGQVVQAADRWPVRQPLVAGTVTPG